MTICVMSQQTLKTPSEVRAWLERHGVTVSGWARAHGFPPSVVFAVLSGRTRGRHGQAHRAAVALGLKETALVDEESPLAEATGLRRADGPRTAPILWEPTGGLS